MLVYDSVYSTYRPAVFPEKERHDFNYGGEHSRGKFDYSSSAEDEAFGLKNRLTSGNSKYHDNPILLINPYSDCSHSFSEFIKSPYVIRVDLPYEAKTELRVNSFSDITDRHEHSIGRFVEVGYRVPNENPENYLKPLDVVWTKKRTAGNEYYHVGIYLGNERVCHYSGDDKKQYEARVIITDWESFVKGCIGGEVFGYHSVIPFKHYREIAQQIDGAEDNYYWKGKYCLANNNCEHRVNSLVYGIDYSKQVGERPNASIDNCKSHRGENVEETAKEG